MPVDPKLPVDVGTANVDSEIIEGIHVLLTRNKTFYREKAIRNALSTWVSPYNKPYIKNHDTETEPLGRVIGAVVTKSVLMPEYTTARLYLDVKDPDAQAKLQDGRYQTFSIGASVDSVTCSVCEKDILKEDFCGHLRGRTYEGNMCYWFIESISSFDEISTVNVPSDPLSMRVTNQVRKGEVKEGMSKAGTMSEADVVQTLETIDSLLAGDEEAPVVEALPETDAEAPTTEDQNPEIVGDETTTEDNEPTVDELQAQLSEAQAQLTTKDAALTELTERITVLEADLTARASEVEDLQTQVTTKESTVFSTNKQNLDLARLALNAYREHAATLALFAGEVGSREAAEQQFAGKSIGDLRKYCIEALQITPTRPEQRVHSPAEGIETEESASGTNRIDEAPIETQEAFEAVLLQYMTRKR